MKIATIVIATALAISSSCALAAEGGSAGGAGAGWCFVPNIYLVAGDVMLAQKIALETDELGALAVAKEFSPSRR